MNGSVLVDANVLLDVLIAGDRHALNQLAKMPDCRSRPDEFVYCVAGGVIGSATWTLANWKEECVAGEAGSFLNGAIFLSLKKL